MSTAYNMTSLDKVRHCFKSSCTLQDPEELWVMTSLVQAFQPKRIVELGVFRAGSFGCWTGPEVRAVGVDTPGTPEFVDKIMEECCPNGHALLIRGHTGSPETVRKALEFLGGPIDFMFIDAEHTYESVKRDFELWVPYMRTGGIVGFHDINSTSEDGTVNVRKFWDEIKTRYATVEIQKPVSGMGIGVVFTGPTITERKTDPT